MLPRGNSSTTLSDKEPELCLSDLVEEINLFRKDPRTYAQQMANHLLAAYDGNTLIYPISGVQLETLEGMTALRDCIDDLSNATPLPAMSTSSAINDVCQQHLDDLCEHDFCSHIGTDCSTPEERLARVGEHREQCGENIVFGMQNATEVLYHMLIDDGVLDRGHRANLLNMDFHFVGLAHGNHPTTKTVTIALFVDHFRARGVGKMEQIQKVTEAFRGPLPTASSAAARVATTQMHWDGLMEDVKPDHLKVPRHVRESVQRMANPRIYGNARGLPPRIPLGRLMPKPRLDPAMVRAFVHRLDTTRQDGLEISDVVDLAIRCEIDLTRDTFDSMFDSIIAGRRVFQDRLKNVVGWREIFDAARPHKEWVPAFEIFVERESDRYQLIVDVGDMEEWCHRVTKMLEESTEEPLPPPPFQVPAAGPGDSMASNAPRGAAPKGRNRQGTASIRKISEFLASLLTAKMGNGELVQQQKVVQELLAPAQVAKRLEVAPIIVNARCMGRKSCWAHTVRVHSGHWMQLMRAAGFKGQIPTPVAQQKKDKLLIARVEEFREANRARSRRIHNKSTAQKQGKAHNAAGSMSMMGASRATGPAPSSEGAMSDPRKHGMEKWNSEAVALFDGIAARPRDADEHATWDEHQQQTEALVNSTLLGATMYSRSAAPAFTFTSRRLFERVLAKEQRTSDESRRQKGRSCSAPVADVAKTSSQTLGPLNGDPSEKARATSQTLAKKDRPKGASTTLGHRFDGEHIDHNLTPPVFEDPKYSRMTKEERDRQFTCYFGRGKKHVSGTTAMKCRLATEQHVDEFTPWKPAEFRDDVPARHGNFGRRRFDPQVREKPVDNLHGISEIENLPMEHFLRQQGRVHEFLDRSLPHGQAQHFQTYLPRSQKPRGCMEMATGKLVLSGITDGVTKRPEMGFGQNRHSGPMDMKLYTRPLDASQLNRDIPIA